VVKWFLPDASLLALQPVSEVLTREGRIVPSNFAFVNTLFEAKTTLLPAFVDRLPKRVIAADLDLHIQ
jgi:hypothetical protein